jgi:hypothetical protein
MARRASSAGNGVSLFPFMSILACLIGILTLMISVTIALKSMQTAGRGKEELTRAGDHQSLISQHHSDRVHLVDAVTAKKMVMTEFEKVSSQMLRETVKVKGGRDRKIYDQEKLVKHFASLNLTLRGQTITVAPNRAWTSLPMRVGIDTKNGGVTLAEMANPRSEWHRLCNLVRSLPRSVLIFRVHTNGFPAYLLAREIADRFNIPCGWEISGSVAHLEALKDFEVNRLEQPKPRPAKPAGPPPPKNTLD